MTVTDVSPFVAIEIIDLLIKGVGMRKIANGQGLTLADVKAIAEASGHPDEQAMRRAKTELKNTPKMPSGPPPRRKLPAPARGRTNPRPAPAADPPPDHPAIPVIQRLSVAARDLDPTTIGALINGLDLEGRAELITTMAAIIPPGADLAAALEWIDLPPGEWSPETTNREAARWAAGDRDATAETARKKRGQLLSDACLGIGPAAGTAPPSTAIAIP